MKTILLQETSNFRIIEVNGGPYASWEQIALPKAAKNYMMYCIALVTAPFYGYSINYNSMIYIYGKCYFKILTSSASNYQNLEMFIEN
jgi:hypothetical protein